MFLLTDFAIQCALSDSEFDMVKVQRSVVEVNCCKPRCSNAMLTLNWTVLQVKMRRALRKMLSRFILRDRKTSVKAPESKHLYHA